jgi:hypothetical protein
VKSHLAQLRLMRVSATGANAAALDHAIGVLAACETLNQRAIDADHVGIMGPSGDEPTWSVEDVEAPTLEAALIAYAESQP